MRDRLKPLCRQARMEEHAALLRILDELGYVPLEKSHEICRAASAVGALHIACVIVVERESGRFAQKVDAMMCALMNVYPKNPDEMGEWMISRLTHLIDTYVSDGEQ